MTVRAKFSWRTSSTTTSRAPTPTRTSRPVFGTYGDGKVNESWSKWTPSGHIQMTITNPSAIDQFEKGKAYFVDFTPAD